MTSHLRVDLLRLVCAQLDSLEAAYIRSLDPHCLETHQTAYLALRRTGAKLPVELQEQFLAAVLAAMDARTEGAMAHEAAPDKPRSSVSVLRPDRPGPPVQDASQTG